MVKLSEKKKKDLLRDKVLKHANKRALTSYTYALKA